MPCGKAAHSGSQQLASVRISRCIVTAEDAIFNETSMAGKV
jgi:hypothetical protein